MKPERSCLKILISAGPTREFIDPVRFISNRSTGTFGLLLAQTAQKLGHKVILLLGPGCAKPKKDINTVDFTSALELRKLMHRYFDWADCVISAAAVSDFRPARVFRRKIKKTESIDKIILKKNPDILQELGKKKKGKMLVGFALETDDLIKNAKTKLRSKNLDLVIANKLGPDKNPFGPAKTSVSIISRGNIEDFEQISKAKLARIILDRLNRL